MTAQSSSTSISIGGRYFWRGNERFFIRGVVYQPKDITQRGIINDPISDDRILELERNIVLLKELGVNTLHIYSIDNQKQHDKAMKLLESAGIYVVAGVCTPSCCINRMKPYESYNTANISSLLRTAGIMAAYPNTLAITAANELVNGRDNLHATPVLKAVVRDLKRYLLCNSKTKGTRILPVGYCSAAVPHINLTPGFLEYLYYGDKEATVDFWSFAEYGWTGKSNIQISGWNRMISRYENFAIPMFLSEYGANTSNIRSLDETRVLYSNLMAEVFSGGCIYELFDGANRYGLIAMPGDGPARWFEFPTNTDGKIIEKRETDAGDVYIYQDFANYKKALDKPAIHDPSWSIMEHEAEERHNIDTTQMTWPWGPEYQMPATCIDWDNVEDLVVVREDISNLRLEDY